MGGYDKKGNMVLPVTNENGMNNVTLPEVTVTPRNINLAGAVDRGRREAAPYVSTLLTGEILAFIHEELDDDMLGEQPSNNT